MKKWALFNDSLFINFQNTFIKYKLILGLFLRFYRKISLKAGKAGKACLKAGNRLFFYQNSFLTGVQLYFVCICHIGLLRGNSDRLECLTFPNSTNRTSLVPKRATIITKIVCENFKWTASSSTFCKYLVLVFTLSNFNLSKSILIL